MLAYAKVLCELICCKETEPSLSVDWAYADEDVEKKSVRKVGRKATLHLCRGLCPAAECYRGIQKMMNI